MSSDNSRIAYKGNNSSFKRQDNILIKNPRVYEVNSNSTNTVEGSKVNTYSLAENSGSFWGCTGFDGFADVESYN